ncbi:MAG: tetratricopeptide repeat protein [Candidatus Dormiibacterota bacterium]
MSDRSARAYTWLTGKGRWITDRPWATVALLAVVGIGIRHAWLSPLPLSAGDWHWPDNQVLTSYSPWPSVWDGSLGLGGENRFSAAFRFPVLAASGLLSAIGIGWAFTEKFLYFVPFAVLLPVGGWLLAREIMGRTKWALLTPLILLGATYFMLEADGEVPLALGEVISFFVLVAFLRTVRTLSLRWALLTGLLLAVVAAYDVRPAYLCVLLMAMYFLIIAVSDRDRRVLLRRTLLGAAAGAVFIGTQAFWLVPLLTYHGSTGLPIPQAPNFNVISLGHGLAALDAFWTGGNPAQLVQAPLNPAYMILPLLAFTPMLMRRLRPEVLWLLVAALLFAFFAKTDNAPLGQIYDWMYLHVPGWKLFREGSKFLYIVTLAYAILIPIALASAFEWASANHTHLRARLVRRGAALGLVGVVALSAWSVVVLQSGSLGSTTSPTPEPTSFSALSQLLAADSRPGPVLWFGQPLIGDNIRNHHFLVASPTHPAVNLTGKFAGTRVNQRDPFQLYCADNLIPYCYLDSPLFPYLTQMAGAGYIVVPGGQAVGSLPPGITRQWLQQQMSAMFGAPTVLGSGSTTLLVWRLSTTDPAVTTAPAIAVVDSGTWATTESLPALEALGLPAAYRESFDNNQYPVAPANLPDAVTVMPRFDNACQSDAPGSAALMVQSQSGSLPASIQTTVGSGAQTLQLLTPGGLPRAAGWGVYGPFSVATGNTTVSINATSSTSLTPGPCVSWSSLTATALGARANAVTAIRLDSSEQITVTTNADNGTWVELRRYYDPGWRLDTHKPLTLGDGLFNLYHLKASQSSSSTLAFAYSTLPYERIGDGITILVLIAAVWLTIRVPRRLRFVAAFKPLTVPDATFPPSRVATWVAGIGLAMLAVTAGAVTLEWFGIPSLLPEVPLAGDPYAIDVGYGGLAIGLLLLSVTIRFVTGAFSARTRLRAEHEPPAPSAATISRPATAVGSGVGLLVVALVFASCGSAGSVSPGLLSEAAQAGSVAPTILGSSLDDARLQRAARQPDLCISDYTTALQQFPGLLTAFVGRGDCYLNGGQNGAAAVHDYTAAIQLSPLQADLYLRRAVAYRVIGNLTAAIADYRTAALNPSATAGELLTAIDGLVAVSDYQDAQAVYNRALVLDPQSSLLYVAGGDLATALGSDQRAAADYANALALPGVQVASVLAHECHAEVLQHNYSHALTDCASAAQLSSSGSGAYDDLAETNLSLGNLSAALKAIDQAISTFIGNVGPYAQPAGVDGFGLANLYAARGWIEIQQGAQQQAVVDFNTALSSLPSSAPDTRARIKAYIETAKKD